MTITTIVAAKPFMKYPGGKFKEAPAILSALFQLEPEVMSAATRLPGTYREPFFGAGGWFSRIQVYMHPGKTLELSDADPDLVFLFSELGNITSYSEYDIRAALRSIANAFDDDFYGMRARMNEQLRNPDPEIEIPTWVKALALIVYNKMCFNGLWRKNKKGEFNAPAGDKTGSTGKNFINVDTVYQDIVAYRQMLQSRGYYPKERDYRDTFSGISDDDFVFVDPPYVKETATSFTYSDNGTAFSDQECRDWFFDLPCPAVMTQSDTTRTRQLYENNRRDVVVYGHEERRSINRDGGNRRTNTLVIVKRR